MRSIAPIYAAANMRRVVASRRRRAAGDWFTGNHYLTSDGSAGNYALTDTDLAAKVFLPGSALGTGTFVCWIQDATPSTTIVMRAYSDTASYVGMNTSSSMVRAAISDNASTSLLAACVSTGKFGASTWTLCAVKFAGGASDTYAAYCADATPAINTDGSPGAYGTGTEVSLMASNTGGTGLSAKLRSPAVFARALSDAEIAALHTLGPTHDLRVASGDYTGAGPVHWWPADGDSGTTVTDRGSVGGCNLTLNGNVTIAEAA